MKAEKCIRKAAPKRILREFKGITQLIPSPSSNMHRNVIVVGGSSGSLEALARLFKNLPEDLKAALFIVMHTGPDSPAMFAKMIGAHTRLPTRYAMDAQRISKGTVSIAPAEHHMLLARKAVKLCSGPKENRFRPAIDPLFRSAAAFHGRRVIAVLLSGYLDDGVAGLLDVQTCGGTTIVQSPEDAKVDAMPRNALNHMKPDHVARAAEMGALLHTLVGQPLNGSRKFATEKVMLEISTTGTLGADPAVMDKLGARSDITCPDCGGALWEIRQGSLVRYRCHIGHAYTSQILALQQKAVIDQTLEIALRSMQDSVRLAKRIAANADKKTSAADKTHLRQTARKIQERVEELQSLIGS